jgi:ribosomal protein S18 acetylase RimI-like enzyme
MRDDLALPPELQIVPVEDAAMLRRWMDVWGFDMADDIKQQITDVYAQLGFDPDRPLRHYVGLLHGEPVSVAAIFEGAGVASVQHVVTPPAYRRRGFGAAMTVHVMREAQKRGYRYVVLTASPDGINIYRRLGFQEYCTMSTYVWHPRR